VSETRGCGGWLAEARNIVLLGPPGTGKPYLATALGIAAAHAGHRVAFVPATGWITRLAEAHRIDRLDGELRKISRYGLIVIDLCRPRNYADNDVMIGRGSVSPRES
jgi:DNA replication protein DnaC